MVPFTLISKCKCGPVEFPVEPTVAIACPCATVWPCVTPIVLQWAYKVSMPFPWEIFTQFP